MFFASLLRSQDSRPSTNTSFSSLPWLADRAPLVGPTLGEGVFHLLFRCLRDVLLLTELLIPLMFRFSADIGHAGFLVFKNVKDFALHCARLEFVAWKRGVELMLLCGLWSADTETGCGE